MSETTKPNSNNNRATKQPTKNKSAKRKQWRRNRSRGPKVNPVSIGSNFHQTSYKFHRQGENSLIIEGVDLLFSHVGISDVSTDSHIFATIPMNPLYWDGTKIKTQAATWQKFKPLMFDVTYTPIVPTTTTNGQT